jgi:hypothetical protein
MAVVRADVPPLPADMVKVGTMRDANLDDNPKAPLNTVGIEHQLSLSVGN